METTTTTKTTNEENEKAPSSSSSSSSSAMDMSMNIIVLGMAGSGKSKFTQMLKVQLSTYYRKTLKEEEFQHPYIINLDPAVHNLPYVSNIDIRDTIKYKEIMKSYGLGPNGAIVTSLNLFCTKFDQVLQLITNCKKKHIIIDTPGQIEVFNWSASGLIVTESLAATCPTVIVYIIDIERSSNPMSFMSNMLYACSILFKYRLPFILVMNKCDKKKPSELLTWMEDFSAFNDALSSHSSYSTCLARSLSLALDEFYSQLKHVTVSSATGYGFDKLIDMLTEAKNEFNEGYRKEYEKLKMESEADKKENIRKNIMNFDRDRLKDINNIVERTENISINNPFDAQLSVGDDEEQTINNSQESSMDKESFQNFLKSSK
ncbi:hypothetical protein SNEBB_006998 [Seison nebaliae]|nr:hypothetical protein SNEBB_006998 [Seison nebaliae]